MKDFFLILKNYHSQGRLQKLQNSTTRYLLQGEAKLNK